MRKTDEYNRLMVEVLEKAEEMVQAFPVDKRAEARTVITFARDYGCVGYPSGRLYDFNVGGWLSRRGSPNSQREAVTVIPCFSDDVSPVQATKGITPGVFFRSDQAIVLFDVDHWSVSELALVLLHEFRHARHRVGPRIASLRPLEDDQIHEVNTWIFTLNILAAWGGLHWRNALQDEHRWLSWKKPAQPQPGTISYLESGNRWQSIKLLFGPTVHPNVQQFRNTLLAIQANAQYWAERDPLLTREMICAALVARLS